MKGSPVRVRASAFSKNLADGASRQFPELAGARVQGGNKLVISLRRRVADFLARLTLPFFCPVPRNLPVDPEGVGAPLAGSDPYFVSTYVRRPEVVIRRNRVYRGGRPHHLDGFVIRLAGVPPGITARIERGEADWTPSAHVAREAYAHLARKYGVGKSRSFVRPSARFLFVTLNTSGRLFRNNVVLRRAVNFAIDAERSFASMDATAPLRATSTCRERCRGSATPASTR